MTEHQRNTVAAVEPVADTVIERFTSFVKRLAHEPEAAEQLVTAFTKPDAARAYAAFVLYAAEAAPDSDLVQWFEDAYIGSFQAWDELRNALLQQMEMLDPVSNVELEQLRGLPLLDLQPEVEGMIWRRIGREYQVIRTTGDAFHVFRWLD